ncbi:MAG: hypothetical protein AAF571_04945 [Verrucomicrobiota bacterium]
MTTRTFTPAQRWKGWFFSGLTAYVEQGLIGSSMLHGMFDLRN